MGRSKKQEGEEGAPMWIVTFSDLMSLLLTFFVLLLSFSTISEEDFNDAMASLQGAFFGVLPLNTGVISMHQRQPRRTKDEVSQTARRLRRRLQVLGLERQVKIEYDAVGGMKISLPGGILFQPGSATLHPDAGSALQSIAEVLGEVPETFVEVRGHTDDAPLTSTPRFRDNHELSYFRADAVARQLINFGGIPMRQFEIVSCGPSQPVATNNTEEGRIANRRVDIYVRGLVNKSKMESLQEDLDGPAGDAERAIEGVTLQELQ